MKTVKQVSALLYLSDSIYMNTMDKKYGKGASEFIGEALKFYSESMKACK